MAYIEWLRRRIGHRKTILVYATVILRDQDGRILLQQRSDFAWWGLPGGILEPGEDILSCARRELREETGLESGPFRLVGIYSHPRYDVYYPNGDETQQFSVTFEGQVDGGTAEPDGDEILSLAFCTEADIESLAMPVWYRTMIGDVLRGRSAVFDPPDDDPHTTQPLFEWQLPGVILPAAVVVVQRADSRLFMPVDSHGVRRFPQRLMELGETVAETAVRAAADQGQRGTPERLLGIVSALGGIDALVGDGRENQVVAAVMLLRAESASELPDSDDWITEAKMTVVGLDGDGLARQVTGALRGRYFVDQTTGDTV